MDPTRARPVSPALAPVPEIEAIERADRERLELHRKEGRQQAAPHAKKVTKRR
jgi:hypothetical protein